MRTSSLIEVFVLIFELFVGYCEEIPGSGSLCMNDYERADIGLKLIGLPKQQQGTGENVFVMKAGSDPFSVTCMSQKPVNWTFSGVMSNSKVHIERYRNHEATCHVMRLHFEYFAEEQTGIYTCYEIGRIWENQNFTIFAGHESAYLRFRGRTIDINQPLDSESIYLPCSVNDPNVTVTLLKEIQGDIQGWKIVEKSDYNFDPIFGYKIKFNISSDSLPAKYKCETGITPIDAVRFNYKLIEVGFRPNTKSLVFAPLPAKHEFECKSLYPVEINSTSPIVLLKNQLKFKNNSATATLTLDSSNLINRQEINGTISCFLTENDTIIWTWNFRVSGTNFKPGLSFDSNTGSATCSSAAPDSLRFFRVFCELLTKCGFMSSCLKYTEDWRCCASLRRKPDIVSSNETSVTVDMPPVSGALRCFGIDLDETIFLYTDTNGKLQVRTVYIITAPFHRARRIYKEKLISVIIYEMCNSLDFEYPRHFHILGIDDDKTNRFRVRIIGKSSIVEGETITAECIAAQRFYYNYLKFELWKSDQRLAFVERNEFVKDENKTELGLFKRKAEFRVIRTDVDQIRCFAEIYEEKDGYTVEDHLSVEAWNMPPTIFGPKTSTVEWTENGSGNKLRNLTCEAEDFILPKLAWNLPPNVAKADVDINENNAGLKSTSQLIIPVIERRFEGTYSCSARNKYGVTQRLFQVAIHSSTINWSVIVIVVLVVTITLSAGVLAYFWRTIKRSKQQIRSNPLSEELEMLHPNAQLYLEEFRRGKSSESECDNFGFEDHEGHYVAVMSAYDHEEYEIPKDLLKFDRKDILGAGEQGIVFKGILQGGKFGDPAQVAIKTLKQRAQFDSVKTLLTEIKVLIYVGSHTNIISLMGACTETSNISELCLVTNFCSLGTLERYLRDGRRNFQNLISTDGKINSNPSNLNDEIESSNTPPYIYQCSIPISTIDLVHWAIQIANGMEYLAEKRVIHGDLATRNVLLDDRGIAKISDFGLSKRLYQYTQYVKQQQVALPWRWMAIESLRDLNFSSNSDVWAYGVTIWEIFALAEVPYPGILWSLEFLQQLLGGLRMLQPQFATEEIYSLLLKCWEKKSQDRPKMSTIKEELWGIIRALPEECQNPRQFVDSIL